MGLGFLLELMLLTGAGAALKGTTAAVPIPFWTEQSGNDVRGGGIIRFGVVGDRDGGPATALDQAEDGNLAYLPLVLNSGMPAPQPTATSTPTFTTTPVATATPTIFPSATLSVSATPTATGSPTATATATPTPEITPTPIVERCKIENGSFELGAEGEAPPWIQEGRHAGELVSGTLPIGSPPAGRRAAWFGGEALSEDRLYQALAIPDGATGATLSYQAYVRRFYDGPTTLDIELRDADQQVLQSIATIGVRGSRDRWFSETHEVDLAAFAGQTILLYLDFQTQQANDIFVDDVSFDACVP